jgi:D-alanine transaminase
MDLAILTKIPLIGRLTRPNCRGQAIKESVESYPKSLSGLLPQWARLMARIVFLNGKYIFEAEAQISIFDRGFLMADGVYEVTAVLSGKLVSYAAHMARLARSLSQMEIADPFSPDQWLELHRQLIARNQLNHGIVYMQVTRGNPGERSFVFPLPDTPPTVVGFTQTKPELLEDPQAKRGWKVITLADQRWDRRDIKTIQLLYSSMAKMTALRSGADDAWFVEDNMITEGTSNNAYIIRGNQLFTRPLGNEILPGVTRDCILELAEQLGLSIVERSFSVQEAYEADEAFITSATTFVMPVVQIDHQMIGTGQPGPLSTQLRSGYIRLAQHSSI